MCTASLCMVRNIQVALFDQVYYLSTSSTLNPYRQANLWQLLPIYPQNRPGVQQKNKQLS